MNKKIWGLLIGMWQVCILSHAQQCHYTVKGFVIDRNEKTPLSSTHIQIFGTKKESISNQNGYFAIDSVCPGIHELHISHLLCEHFHITLPIYSDTTLTIYIDHQEQVFKPIKKVVNKTYKWQDYVSSEQIERNKGQSISALMSEIAGITMIQSGANISKPMVNGLYGSRVLIINNGIRQEGQNWGTEHAPEIDAFLANDITLVKGAESLRYGADGIGGVILVNSPSIFYASSKQLRGVFNTVGMSNGRAGIVSAYLGNKISTKFPLSWRLQGTAKNAGSYSIPGYNLANTGSRELNYSAHLGFEKKYFKSELFYSQFYNKNGLYPGAMTGNLSDLQQAMSSKTPMYQADFSRAIQRPFQQVNHQLLKIKTVWQKRYHELWEATISYQKNHREEYDILRSRSAYAGPSFDYYINTLMGEVVWKNSNIRGHYLSAGLVGLYQSNAYTGKFFIPGFYQKSFAQFFMTTIKDFELALRNDFKQYNVYLWNNNVLHINSRQYKGPSYIVQWHKKINKQLKIILHQSYTWRAPAPNELYANGLHQALASIEKGDSALKKEKSLNFSSSFQYSHKKLLAEAELFVKYINGYINLVPDQQLLLTIRGAFPVYRYEQSNARLSGLNLNIRYQMHKNWKLTLKSQIMYGSDLSRDKYLSMMPPINGKLGLYYGKQRLKADMSIDYTGRQYRYEAGSDFLPPPPGYVIAGSNWTYQFKIKQQLINCSIGFNNLLNTRYRTYLNRLRYFSDEQGRQIIFKIVLPINTNI